MPQYGGALPSTDDALQMKEKRREDEREREDEKERERE
jgi:hypothetical protein